MRPHSRLLSVCVLLFLCTPGCKRSASTPAAPEAAPGPGARSTSRTASPVPDAILIIDGLRTAFPPPDLRIQQRDGETFVQIYSHEPKGSADGQPNTYMFDMPLEVEGENLDGAQWHFPSTNRERLDSPNGIFLAGGELVLQPFSGAIRFAQHGQDVSVEIDGEFLAFPAQDSTPADGTLRVTGRLEVKR